MLAPVLLLLLSALVPSLAHPAVPLLQREASRERPSESATVPATLEDALRAVAVQADVIFTGEVRSIDRVADAVEVRWQVEDAVRGTAAGQVYILREWAGLWQANGARYVQGERALLLLHAPSAGGYASPVGGADGVIALHGDAGSGTMDLRLLQQRVLVTDAARLRPAHALQAAGGSLTLSDALQREYAARQAVRGVHAGGAVRSASHTSAQVRITPDPDGSTSVVVADTHSEAADSSTDNVNSRVDAGIVVGLLKAWQQRGAAR